MKRNVDINQISDGNLYNKDSIVKISCNDCAGCDKCCHNMGESIILDPYDIYQITKITGKTFQMLMQNEIELFLYEGVILPHIKMRAKEGISNTDEDGVCSFINNGRCSIHEGRPGFCRLFPLGRLYKEDGTFDYINQIYECEYPNKSKIKIKKWLGIPNISKYEAYITKWHNYINDIKRKVADNEEAAKECNMSMLNAMFMLPYDVNADFYLQFEERMQA